MLRADKKLNNIGVTQRFVSRVKGVPIKSGARLLIASVVCALLVVLTADDIWPLWLSALIVVAVILPVLYFSYHLPARAQAAEPQLTTLRDTSEMFRAAFDYSAIGMALVFHTMIGRAANEALARVVGDAARIVAALKSRFPAIVGPKKDDICYATQNRQDAVKFMAPLCDVVIVVGSPNSSNSNRLREVAANLGRDAYLIDSAADLRPEWIEGKRSVGVTAGASAPEVLVHEVILRLQEMGARRVRELDGIEENVTFPLPRSISGART